MPARALLFVALHCACSFLASGFVLQPARTTIRQTRAICRLYAAGEPNDGDAKPEQPPQNDGSMSLHEGSLPLSFRSDDGRRDAEFYLDDDEKSLNPYFDVVRRLSPSELIGRFVRTGSPRVQEAVRTTVLGLLGSLPKQAFETATITTGDALANLMFQLQMTGYMFRNAEYRLSLQTSLRGAPTIEQPLLSGDAGATVAEALSAIDTIDDNGNIVIKKPTITGKVKLTYENGQEVEVDAGAYMAELASQVNQLQSQLAVAQNKQQQAQSKDLLVFIRSMPESQLKGLSENISPEVLNAMKMLVETVMNSMAGQQIGTQTLTQQSGAGMAQLCMWQLAVGYNLREMEAREEVRKKFEASSD